MSDVKSASIPAYLREAELRHLRAHTDARALIIPDRWQGHDYRDLARRACAGAGGVRLPVVATPRPDAVTAVNPFRRSSALNTAMGRTAGNEWVTRYASTSFPAGWDAGTDGGVGCNRRRSNRVGHDLR